nr:immunoglobulin light chain junction region [Macaca mulatta]MOV62569.1 immunoglobulin light chain junction region [Macaca mulatta]MOV62950.1 immunoglobulin light chain junction region [Macaca mulatta]MOV62989.1 immunoglobulin light chain junction region [Macaca mulatta]MOV63008.1 immunoglobulin light chain junction region [Macaca mulatta]
CLQSSNWPYTF